ncbi:MAG: GNAT family N-acetyltransferase [Sphingobacteriales bacterium]|nr:MAG: GNAT family N-acetyltransferase [Sphingobacteriales bacterium]
MSHLSIVRTDSANADFKGLVAKLDLLLLSVDGDEHTFYAPFNNIDKISEVVVAYRDKQPIGCGAIKPFDDDQHHNAAEIKRMYVAPEYRRQGVAVRILMALEEWAAELNYKKCILETLLRMHFNLLSLIILFLLV